MTRLPRFVLPHLSLFTLVVAGACAGGTDNGGDDDDGPDAAVSIDAATTDAPLGADASIDASTDAPVGVDAAPDAMAITGDTCAMADVITISGGLGNATVSGTTASYANDYMPPAACTDDYLQDGPDHVYQVAVPAGARLSAVVSPASGYDPGIYLVAAPAAMCDASPIVCLAGADDGLSGAPDLVRYQNTTAAAVEVFIVIDGTSTTGGAFSLAVTVAEPPPGDTCQSAETVTLTSGMAMVSATTATASGFANDYDPTDASCEDGAGNDRVHTLTVPAGERLTATVTPAAGFDVTINVVGGPAAMCDASPITCLESVDGGAGGTAESVTYDNTTASPVEIMLVVDGYDTDDEGTYDLAVTVAAIPPAPAGDTCQLAEAITLTGGTATVTGTTETSASYADDYVPPSGCAGGSIHDGNDHVHSVTVPAGERLTATVTPTTTWDPSIYFVAGPAASCDANPITCLAGADAGSTDAAETITYDNTTGAPVDVMIVVDSYDPSSAGTYSLQVTAGAIPPAPAGDTCQLAEAITLTGGMATVTGTTATAAGYLGDYAPSGSPCVTGNGNDRVHSVTVPDGQRLTATLTPTGFDATVNLVAGPAAMCDAMPVVCLAGRDGAASGGVETVSYDNTSGAPVEVLIMVDGYYATSEGAYALDVAVAAIP